MGLKIEQELKLNTGVTVDHFEIRNLHDVSVSKRDDKMYIDATLYYYYDRDSTAFIKVEPFHLEMTLEQFDSLDENPVARIYRELKTRWPVEVQTDF